MVGQPYAGPDCDLRPDAEQITAFVQHWFAFCTLGALEIGWLDPGGRGLVNFRQFSLDGVAELAATAVVENLAPGQSMYIRAATVRVRSDGGFTRDSDMVQAPGLWGDLDTPEQMERARQVVSMFRPTCRVLTGSVPYERAQLWFRCSEPLVGPENVRQLNQGLWRLYGGDPAVVNPTRLMRLPGTIAWPVKPGRVPELTMLVQYADGRPLAHPVASLRSFLRLGEEAGPASVPVQPEGMLATLSRWDEVLRLVRAGAPGWHNSMVALVGHWVSRGWTAREILAAAESFRQPGYTLEETLVEVWRAVEGAFRKQFEPPGGEGDPGAAAEGWDQPGPAPGRAGGAAIELLHYLDVLSLEPPGFLVEGLLPAEGLSVVYGEPKSGKTFLVLAWAVHIVAGLAWYGRAVRQGAVVYIAAEGIGGMGDRIEAAMTTAGVAMGPELPFYFIRRAINFLEPGAAAALIAAVRAVVPAGVRVAMVVIDTLARGMPGGDENSAQHLGLVIAAGGEVQAELHCAVVPIHHMGKDEKKGMRGSTALRGAVEASFSVTRRARSSRVVVRNVDQKDAEPAADMAFDMVKVELPPRPMPPNSLLPPDERSSLVLVPIGGQAVAEEAAAEDAALAGKGLTDDQKLVLEMVDELLASEHSREAMPDEDSGYPEGGGWCVTLDMVRTEYLMRNGAPDEQKEVRAYLQTLRRIIKRLIVMRRLGRRSIHLWPIRGVG
jgi:hypothetical protein